MAHLSACWPTGGGHCGISPALLYVAVPAVALVMIRADPDRASQTMVWIIALVVAADTGGYLVGRTVGGPKLAPADQPQQDLVRTGRRGAGSGPGGPIVRHLC